MIRAIRWQSLIPRLLLLAVVLLAAQYVIGRIARRLVIGSLQSACDTNVTLAQARVSLWNRQLDLSDLGIFGSEDSARPPITIDRCALHVAATPLLYRRTVVDRGYITGLRLELPGIVAERSTVPKAVSSTDPGIPSSFAWPENHSIERAGKWLASLNERFQFALIERFKSVDRTAALCDRWPTEAAKFDQQVSALRRRAAALQQEIEVAQVNPLRHLEFFQRLPREVDGLRQELTRAIADLDELSRNVDTNREEIIRLRRDDAQLARQEIQFEPVDAQSLTAYLLREQACRPVEQVISALRWIRLRVPAQSKDVRPSTRGNDVYFIGCEPTASLQFNTLRLQGTARFGGQPMELRGTLTDLSNSPSDHPRPIRLRLQADGSSPLDLQVNVDRTGPVPRDELLIDCRGIVLPKHSLGRREELQLNLAPSVGTLSVSVLADGDKLSGDIQLVQKQLRIAPVLSGQLTDVPIAAALQDTLADVNSVAIRLSLGGTLDRPTCSMWSNLGPAVAEAMDRALRRAGEEHAQTLLVRANRLVDERIAALRQQALEQQAQLQPQVTAAANALQGIAAEHAPSPRVTPDQLGRRLPAGSLFR